MSGKLIHDFTVLQSVPPGVAATNNGVHAGRWINLAKYGKATIVYLNGDTLATERDIRLREATDNAGAGAQGLDFSHIYRLGARVYFDPATVVGTFQVGEALTCATGGSGVINSIQSDHFVIYIDDDTTAFDNGVLLTGGTSTATATSHATNALRDTDILIRHEVLAGERVAAALNTFESNDDVDEDVYVIEVDAADLTDGYTHINADIDGVGAADDTGRAMFVILGGKRYAGEPTETAID